jgi:pimeloyl-ACP methyl ester carboxylesterase
MKHLGKAPPFRGPNGEVVPGSIAEIRYLRLGGVDQWVMIRGESPENPLLILLHGGPGFPEMRLFRSFNAPLEKDFTVVYWEQRGTDKSFGRNIPKSSMTVEQFIADLDELVEAMRKRFGKKKVAIYGHSWGSALGVLYAARFPQKVTAYFGAGQIGNWPASEAICYEFTLAEAERRGNRKALRELGAIGPPPHAARKLMVQRKWLTRFVGIVRGMSMWRFSRIIIGGPESSVWDLPNILRGMLFSTYAMWDEVSALDLSENQRCVFRHADGTVKEARMVRGVGARAAVRGTGQVQHGDGGIRAASYGAVSAILRQQVFIAHSAHQRRREASSAACRCNAAPYSKR